jgi:hypothetical protein
MWIATKTGIDRYNGHIIKSYTLPGNFYYGDLAGRKLGLLYHEKYGLWAYDHTGRVLSLFHRERYVLNNISI